MPVVSIPRQRFNALAGYVRQPAFVMMLDELEWYSVAEDRALGVVFRDRIDDDFSWIILGRDGLKRFRGVDLRVSIESVDAARNELIYLMENKLPASDEDFRQGDEVGEPVDFFSPIVSLETMHPSFKFLIELEKFSPARELIEPMMRYYSDIDGNFVQQFQTTGFDTRLWELYLFATLTEMGYARASTGVAPDFIMQSIMGKIGIEAVTVNAPNNGIVPRPTTKEEFIDYYQNYVQRKILRALSSKLKREVPYWNVPEMNGVPFVIAVQDFHCLGAMRMIVPTATECIFGIRHTRENGVTRIERIETPAHFFSLPGSENVSAVILNPQGTLMKFNRIGRMAGFGSPRVRMRRKGIFRGENHPAGPNPVPFDQNVCSPDYQETWVEGMVVLHNPHAKIPLDPELLPDANHEFLTEDGRIMSLLPEFQPYFSETIVEVED